MKSKYLNNEKIDPRKIMHDLRSIESLLGVAQRGLVKNEVADALQLVEGCLSKIGDMLLNLKSLEGQETEKSKVTLNAVENI